MCLEKHLRYFANEHGVAVVKVDFVGEETTISLTRPIYISSLSFCRLERVVTMSQPLMQYTKHTLAS